MERLLIFHPTIAPYRIDFFNDLSRAFKTCICLKYWNLREQTFDYEAIYSKFAFKPVYLKERFRAMGRSFCFGYWKNLNAFNPDVVLTEEFGLGTMLVLLHRFWKRKRYKVVTLCDDSYNMVAERNDFSFFHRMARNLVAPLLDDIVVIEPRTEQWYRKRYGKGFFFPIIRDEAKARDEYRKVLDLGMETGQKHSLDGKKVFLFVGRLVLLKNVPTILRAFSALDQRENVLVIVGDGPEREYLKILADELDVNVLFTGRLEGDALNVWYNLADFLILASYQEAFGAVTNEALLDGCYVLISNKAGSSCLVEEGVNGYTFSPMDVEELVGKMQMIRDFPVVYEDDGMKRNLMRHCYRSYMKCLVNHLKQL